MCMNVKRCEREKIVCERDVDVLSEASLTGKGEERLAGVADRMCTRGCGSWNE